MPTCMMSLNWISTSQMEEGKATEDPSRGVTSLGMLVFLKKSKNKMKNQTKINQMYVCVHSVMK